LILSRGNAHASPMSLRLHIPELPAEDLIELLADPHRSVHAYTRLLTLGPEAAEPARHGLCHPEARVRAYCCKVLDHLMDAESIPALIEALADPAEPVRIEAAHALACDRCKTDACRATPEAVLPPAITMLTSDPSADVRARAAELVGRWVHTHLAARNALDHAAARDPSPAVRKKASWYAPGGPIYRRTRPKDQRRACIPTHDSPGAEPVWCFPRGAQVQGWTGKCKRDHCKTAPYDQPTLLTDLLTTDLNRHGLGWSRSPDTCPASRSDR
jgi:hypothetical protein